MTQENRKFGKRMNAANDKQTLVDLAEGATRVLDLGAGTGKLARDIAEKWGCHVDAVDLDFKDDCINSDLVSYHSMDINTYLYNVCPLKEEKYDYIILSAILHELSASYIINMCARLSSAMSGNCRIVIREPFYEAGYGPLAEKDRELFVNLVKDHIPLGKTFEFFDTPKLSSGDSLTFYNQEETVLAPEDALNLLNLCFTLSYGEQSWEREKKELRYARPLCWCKKHFDLPDRPYTKFEVIPVLDESYRDLFGKAGIPIFAFDLIKYTGMIVVINYDKI